MWLSLPDAERYLRTTDEEFTGALAIGSPSTPGVACARLARSDDGQMLLLMRADYGPVELVAVDGVAELAAAIRAVARDGQPDATAGSLTIVGGPALTIIGQRGELVLTQEEAHPLVVGLTLLAHGDTEAHPPDCRCERHL